MSTKLFIAALASFTFGASAWAQLTLMGGQTDNTLIPDNDLSGISETISLGSSIQSITDVQLTLDIGGTYAWNGDYYAYLTHGSGFAVLLNRVGVVDASNPTDFGYGNTGLDVTFSDSGANIHNYQSGSPTYNANGQLTGTWGPDGRTASPFAVTAASAPTALLSSFDGEDSDGGWTLFIADASPGDYGDLVSWNLQVTGMPATTGTAPDGSNTTELLIISVGGMALWSLRQRRLQAARQ
jgi:subtilisin-like proprotein convertase family protein